jgi:hypothetical protein
MEKILAQQTEILKRLEKLSKEDRVLQAIQTAELYNVDKEGGQDVEALKDIKETLDKGFKSETDNLEKLSNSIKNLDFAKIKELADKDVPLGVFDKLKDSISSLNPLKMMDSVVGKLKDTFSTEKGRYIREETRELRRQDPTKSLSEARDEAESNYNKALEAKKLQAEIDYAIDNDKELPIKATDARLFTTDNDLNTPEDRSDELSTSEEEREQIKAQAEQTELLRQIEENTRPVDGDKRLEQPAPGEGGGGLISGLLGGIGLIAVFKKLKGAIVKGLKALFSAKMVMAALKKVILPAAIIASLFSGVKDAIQEFKESGSIGKALLAGLGGILETLTFGLVDEDTLKSIGNLVSEYVIDPIKNFFNAIRKWIGEKVGKIPGVGKYIKQAFGTDSEVTETPITNTEMANEPVIVSPQSGELIYTQSTQNVQAREMAQREVNKNNIVSAPTSIASSTQNNFVKPTTRNLDNSYNRYISQKYT